MGRVDSSGRSLVYTGVDANFVRLMNFTLFSTVHSLLVVCLDSMVSGNGPKRSAVVDGNDPLLLQSFILAVKVDAMLTSSPVVAHDWNGTP